MSHAKKKPNVLFILIDDLGWKDLGCYGSTFYETPHLDRLAAEGMRFTDAYAAAPVCSPTRASLMSGKYPANVGVTNYIGGQTEGRLIDAPYIRHLPLQEKSVASALQEHGYKTWHVGKWHLGGRDHYPDRHGFDVNIGGCSWGMPMHGFFSPYGIETLEEGPDGEYLTDRLTDEAIRLIRQHDADEPFFLNLWHYAVHIPIEVSEALVERFAAKAQALGLDRLEAFAEGEPFPCEHKKHLRVQRRILQSDPAYAAMIYNLDWNIGRLIDALRETNRLDDTVIVFTSDNGGLATAEGSPTCNSPLQEGKGWMYEGGVREPLIVRWPGVVEPGSVCEIPVTSPDFYPTLLEIARVNLLPEQHEDGISFVPLLKGEDSPGRDALFWHYPHYGNQGGTPGSSVREGDYKLIEFFEDGRLELYNLREDLSEAFNIAEQQPERTEQLHRKLCEWRERIEAKIPEVNERSTVERPSSF
ncbi:sulfatase [Paenibacillus lycopersici]|uniref:Sulfatase n=1 Tax=Paenibacillus lycopersici TaxID=2704462 RepID=A0A6C0G677_9BACL|nr:sulfatase [Paenibacillus lycopersici]QHT62840.1 sulfatase [Paenibacillus lycopersici]